jgi:crossover junction endodeoxyribonuclease RuvC
MRFIGIDPGLDGGIACITEDGVYCWRMPTIKIGTKRMVLTQGVRQTIVDFGGVDLVMIEDVNANAIPVASNGSAFAFGRGYGRVETVVECLDRPYAYVSSPTWTKALGVTKGAGKDEHIAVAARLFPNYRDALTDGMADALLIAEYGRRLHAGRVAA